MLPVGLNVAVLIVFPGHTQQDNWWKGQFFSSALLVDDWRVVCWARLIADKVNLVVMSP